MRGLGLAFFLVNFCRRVVAGLYLQKIRQKRLYEKNITFY